MTKKVVVIGGGPAGYTAAIRASQLGADVTLVEGKHLGGTCLNVGCIPTKSLLESSNTYKHAKSLLQDFQPVGIPWKKIMDRKNHAIKQLRSGVKNLLAAGKINYLSGFATFNGEEIEVTTSDNVKKRVSGDYIIIASGSRPVIPNIPGVQLEGVFTSDEFINLDGPYPDSVAILGGGVIGIEFATILAELGVKVSVIEAASTILPMVDSDIADKVKADLEMKDVTFYIDRKLESVEKINDGHLELRLSNGDKLHVSNVLLAVGRVPNTDRLNLSQRGIELTGKRIKVNKYYETTARNVYAVGDCSSPIMLAHVAIEEAKISVENALGHANSELIYEYVPQCIYTHPEVAFVGLSTEEAQRRGFNVQEGIFPLNANGRAIVEEETSGQVKIVSEKEYGRVLGVHIYAPHATEMISEAVLALNLEATIDEILSTIHPHPTIAEAIPEAVLATNGEAIHLPMKKRSLIGGRA